MTRIGHIVAVAMLVCVTVAGVAQVGGDEAAPAAPAAGPVRGVRQRDLPRYTQSTFQCLDGSKSIPASAINDEFCDCADGSDEPGTSACPNGHFSCRNRGAKGKTIPSSRVNDGVCDCCDGSDEVESYSHVSCPDTCLEAGRAAREAAEREIAATEAGWTVRAALLEKAQVARNEKSAKLAHYEKLMAERKVLLEQAQAVKDAEEAIEKEERDKRAAEKQRIQAERDAAEAKAAEERAAAEGNAATQPAESTTESAADSAAGSVPPQPSETVAPAAESADTPVAAATEPAEAAAKQEENFPYPAEYAYKPNEETAASTSAPAATPEAAAAEPAATENFPYPAEYAYNPDAPIEGTESTGKVPAEDEAVEPEYEHDDDDEEQHTQPSRDEDKEYVHPGAEAARDAFEKLDSKVRRLQRKMDDLRSGLERNYGPDAQFFHMDGQCFSLPSQQYTYEVCPYGKASQKEGGGSTSLGSWEGLTVLESGQYTLNFKNGQTCWQGPARSLTVRLRCGAEDRVVSVEEPSKCVYEMDMETPAVCNLAHAQALKLNLDGGGLLEEEEEE